MAQTGFTPISLYYTTTAAAVPTAGNLVAGELAINTADGKLFYKDSAGVVQVIGTKGGVGSSTTTQVLYNSSGLVVGSANMTFSGTTLTLANDASISGLTVGKGGGSVASNTTVGNGAMAATNSGGSTTSVGYLSLKSNTSGASNTGIGRESLQANTSGSFNNAVGDSALYSNTTGANNTALGHYALVFNTTASNNTAVGYQAGYSNTTGAQNTFIGRLAGYSSTADFGTAVGSLAMQSNTSGASNTAIGSVSLNNNTTGSYNVAVGRDSLASNTTASNNTAVGYQAGYSNTTGQQNVFIGAQAGYTSTGNNNYNTYVGFQAGYNANTTVNAANTFIGIQSGYAITTGIKNTILGAYSGNQSGLDIRTASNYIVLSDGDGNPRGIFNANGDYLVGQTTRSTATVGFSVIGSGGDLGQTNICTSGTEVMNINRNTSDGDLIRFRQDNTVEGTISVSGTTVSYNGGHLSRWSQWQNQTGKPEIYRGSVLESTNDMCEWNQANEQSTKTIVSTTAKSKAVAGVFDMYDTDDEDNPYDFYVAQSGDFVIRIAQGVVVENGDLLESAGDGTAIPQTDDICRSSTIAKVTSNYVSTTYADGSYCVPCILMIG